MRGSSAGECIFLELFSAWARGGPATTECTGAEVLPIQRDQPSLAMFAGCVMVPVVAALDYAHDEGSEYNGWGTDGRFFGYTETRVPFLAFWAMFGASALLPFGGTIARQWIILATCLLTGVDAGLLIQTALYKGDLAGNNKWSFPFVGLFMALAINIGIQSTLARALAIPGAILIILGQKTVFGNRKRGDYWMKTGKPNPNPIVYSYGEPLFMAGWILISLSMALPMGKMLV